MTDIRTITSKRLSIRLTQEEDIALREFANKLGNRIPLSALGGLAVRDFVSRYSKIEDLASLMEQLELPIDE